MDRLSRRRFLALSGGAVIATAATAAGIVGPRRIFDRMTRDGGPRAGLPARSGATIEFGTLQSDRLATGGAGWAIAIPPDAGAPAALPVCYCLPGRGGTARTLVESLRIPDYVAEAVSERDVPPFAVAAVDSGTSYWHPRRSGEDRLSFLFEELIPFVEERLASRANARRALMGWSMGGYGALLAAERDPSRFAAVAVTAPALFTSAEAAAATGAFDDAADFERHDVFAGTDALRGVPLRVDCGADDRFRPAVEAFRDAVRPEPAGGIAPGGHDPKTFRRFAPAQVRFVGAALG